jgi:uncharacterized repeat protein (TIGR01451 family)
MPDGSIILMGGANTITRLNDVWRSTDMGTTWSLVKTNAEWPARYGQSSVVVPDGSIVLTGGTVRGIAGGDVNDVWRWVPVLQTPANQPDGLLVTKTITPVSIKQGTDTVITITVLNRGTNPAHDVEILDTIPPEFTVAEGSMQHAISSIVSNDTGVITYTVHATKPGTFRFERTKVLYADQYGNYQFSYSNSQSVQVLAPLIPPEPESTTTGFIGDLIAWFDGLDREIMSIFG